jgi:hypothetical protein
MKWKINLIDIEKRNKIKVITKIIRQKGHNLKKIFLIFFVILEIIILISNIIYAHKPDASNSLREIDKFLINTILNMEIADIKIQLMYLLIYKSNNPSIVYDSIEAKIKEGSLYEKEFKLLGDIFENSKPKKTTRKKAPKTTSSDNTQLSLDFTQKDEQEKGNNVKPDETEEPVNPEENNGFENADLSSLSMEARISDVLPYSKEMLDIRAKAIANGSFMKAPNGNPTNLNERQWLQVRTKAFKDWFGDWEKGLVVNQDKESFYRGQFDEPFIDKNGNLILYGRDDSLYKSAGYKESKGVSVTRDLKSAIEYGEGQLETRINIVMDSSMDESEQNAVIDNGYYLIQFKDSVSNKEIKEAGESKLLGDITVPKGSYIIEHYVQGELIETIGNINNPNASKVVDENGEPLVVYHHTDNHNLTEFSTDFDNYFAKDGGTKEAIFFDENETGTLNRKYDIPVFLNIKDLNEYNETKQQLHDKGTSYREIVNESAAENNIDGGVHMKDFDDNKMEHQSIWIVHNPNQIKSATDDTGEFSKTDNNIYSISIPSVEEFLDRFPIEDQKQIKESIDNGELSLSCK